eukprot:gnl/TRDRNA2_/TRDRNA2_197041_c0_seq1.p1 gnl/TRDRNA2_/TRDRNA2_197041_c0~~gnl/TRDRNA2_/TRDRNA2_197041_c0_seq1.p1  ORF type:complete len:405 (-),score=49.99 gnl/TRDRNA2_/TRDRNA2_197041_c0_seq1:169-1383(-)
MARETAHRGALKAAHSSISHVASAFQAAARPLCAGALGRQPRSPAVSAVPLHLGPDRPILAELAEGPYFVLALMLDATSLCAADSTCRLLMTLNRAHIGPWRALGARAFHGLELERDGIFESGERDDAECGRKLARMDWKGRYRRFRADVPTFSAPFGGPEISSVAHPDEVAYLRCRLCSDILGETSEDAAGVYLEVEVLVNPDNLSMAVVDFEARGCSSVTFSPDTGAVIRERKVRETPRKVEGAYIQPLPAVPPGRRFLGRMGLYLQRGRLAFFRKCTEVAEDSSAASAENSATASAQVAEGSAAGAVSSGTSADGSAGAAIVPKLDGPWESTGFVSDLRWAEGRRLTPCLAFRDEGAYRVRVVSVGNVPPVPPDQWGPKTATDADWSGFDWEVGPQGLPEA